MLRVAYGMPDCGDQAVFKYFGQVTVTDITEIHTGGQLCGAARCPVHVQPRPGKAPVTRSGKKHFASNQIWE